MDTSNSVFSIKIDNDFLISNVALKIMKKMSYMPGLGLGKNLQGPAKFETHGTLIRTTALGYLASNDSRVKRGDRLEDYFVKEKVKQVYQGQSEPFWDKETNTLLPGFEIFANDVWPEGEEEYEVAKKPVGPADWVQVFNEGSLTILFKEDEPKSAVVEAEVLMLGQEILEDPTSLIMDAIGDYENWVFLPSATHHRSESDSESFMSSESVKSLESEIGPLGPTPLLYFEFESTRVYDALAAIPGDEIKESDFAYFSDFEINCVDPDDEEIDFDENISKEIRSLVERESKRRAQPVKEEVVLINLRMRGIPE